MKHLPTPQPNQSRFAMVFLLFMTFLLCSVQGWGQSTIFAFNFDNGNTVSTNNTAGTPAISNSGVGNIGTSGCNNNGYSGDSWATNDYIRFTFNATGSSSMSFSYNNRASSTNIGTFKVRVSSNGTSWTDIRANYTPTTSCATSGILSIPAALNNASQIFIDILKTSNADQAGRLFRIDDVLLTGVISLPSPVNGVITSSTPNTYSHTFPAFVKGFKAELIGAGGGGGRGHSNDNNRGAGGGGGGFAGGYLVNVGGTYTLNVGSPGIGGIDVDYGQNGGNSSLLLSSTTLLQANGGKGGINNVNVATSTTYNSAGGTSTANASVTGSVTRTGGNGATNAGNGVGNGGGGAAGSSANGNNANAATGGATLGGLSGAGANGASGSNGSSGDNFGGGGSGGGRTSNSRDGGNGAQGVVRLTYVDISNLTVGTNTIIVCQNSTASVTLNSTSLPSGDYVVSYTTTLNSVTSAVQTSTMTFNGTTDAGSFTTVALTGFGQYSIAITRIAVSEETGIYSEPVSALTKLVTVNAPSTPTFTQVSAICSGASLSALPTTSNNGITGTWSPALNNTATTTYTFTPTAGQCASTATMTISVNSNTTPTFTQVSAICSGASLSALPTTSNNGITGTWSPALNNTATTTYTFTPTAGQCATTVTMTITVNPIVTPTFTQVSAICSGASLSDLPTTSNNSITGTWSPALNNTATITYTFTPTAGQCATTATMTITVNPIVTPTFTQVSAICSGASLNALPTESNNNIAGTWSPEVNNTATTEYTFTPTAGQCALTTTMTITVTPTINYYADADGDGYGNASSVQAACSQPTGYVSNNTDCNDNSSSINPGASETCNNSDDNCNGQNNEGLANSASTFVTACATYTWSANGTTYTASGNYNYVDGCNTQVLHLTINTPTLTYYVDADGDNFGTGAGTLYCTNPGAGYSDVNTDCNDANISISPMAEELCDGINNDCNDATADGLGTTTYFRDLDGDTFGDPNSTIVSCQTPNGYVANNTDCDDSDADFHIINTYFADTDEDSYGDENAATEACNQPLGYVVNSQDCDDTNATVNPNAAEICNLIDDDCDGEINDGLTSIDYHFDGDGDGFGSGTATLLCAPTAGYVQNSSDCNDGNAAINPNATEICGNNTDEDCSGFDLAPSYYISVQSGPWATASTWNMSCDNSVYSAAYSAPSTGYYGIATVASGHTVTVEVNNGQIASTQNLNINATGTLVVNGKMSVAQTLVNNGTLTVNHGAAFLQSSTTAVNSGSGAYVVNMNLTGTSANGTAPNGRYWYIGSPMNNTNISGTFYNAGTMTRVWDYITTNNSWSPIINSSTGFGQSSATTMTAGKAYLYRAGANQNVTFNGTSSTFNNNITTPTAFTGTGYKFVSNPYTSHVDWRLVTRTGLNVSYWIRNAANTAYESYNATSGVSNSPSGQTTKDISPMQGFYVYSFAATSSLRIDNGDRVHATNVLHAPMHNQVVRLNLNDGKTDDQAVVYENENANNGIEEFDTDKFMDENNHQVYFLEGTKAISLDGLKDATSKQRVDMGIQITSAGTYTINAVELGVEEDVVLEDKFTHTFQDMKRNSTFSFTAKAGTYNNRFVLHFTLNPQAETAMESVAVTEEVTEVEGVSVYNTTGQQVKVWISNNTDFQNATVKVYDAIGNLIERKNMTSSELLLDLNTATGVYLVEVTGENKTFTKKVFIGK